MGRQLKAFLGAANEIENNEAEAMIGFNQLELSNAKVCLICGQSLPKSFCLITKIAKHQSQPIFTHREMIFSHHHKGQSEFGLKCMKIILEEMQTAKEQYQQ